MNKKYKLLWLSMMAPYDGVAHASGKIHNFYLKHLHKTEKFDIKVLSLCKEEEVSKIDLKKYHIDNKIYVRKRTGVLGTFYKGISWLSKFNPFNKYAGLTPYDIHSGMSKLLQELYNERYVPDIIIYDWTEILFMMPYVSSLFPNAKCVSIEEDVSFLAYKRRMEYTKNIFLKRIYQIKYRKVKDLELNYLKKCDLIILNNRKDQALLSSCGINQNIWVWSPYFQSYLNKENIYNKSKNIVFYGAMFREENWRSVLWFIENVLPLIKDENVKFVIIGSSPNQRLLNLKNPRVIIKGFVDDISQELMASLCLVAPLVLGAGVKIKIIEALSCGIPILTNEIGIEGIPATNKESYFFCESPEDYVEVINDLLENKINLKSIQVEAKNVIFNNFNYEKDSSIFSQKLLELCGRNDNE